MSRTRGNEQKKPKPTCYMCEAESTSREHAPAFAFFPKKHREMLITVPSCDEHNQKNSKDVEYVRNVIVSQRDTNSLAREFFGSTIMSCYIQSPKLADRTFDKSIPVIHNGMSTGIVHFDMPRFKSVIEALAYALYRADFSKNFDGEWAVFSPSMVAPSRVLWGLPDGFEQARRALRNLPFTPAKVANPEVFKYATCTNPDGDFFGFRFEFYEGFIVHAIKRIQGVDWLV